MDVAKSLVTLTWSAGEGISLLIKYLSIDMRRDTQEDYTIEMCTYIADLLLVVTWSLRLCGCMHDDGDVCV